MLLPSQVSSGLQSLNLKTMILGIKYGNQPCDESIASVLYMTAIVISRFQIQLDLSVQEFKELHGAERKWDAVFEW